MVKSLLFFVRFFLFWLLFFFLDRLTFLIINFKKISVYPATEIMSTFYHGLALDFSMSAYLLLLPLISYIFWLFSGKKIVELKWLTIYNKVLIIIFSILSVVNFNIYREWGTKVNAKAIGFAISTPNEAMASSASSPVALSISLLALLIIISLFLQKKVILRTLEFNRTPMWLRVIAVIFMVFINFLIIRGGLKGSPITQSMAYFSKEQVLNNAAVNTEWNLLRSVLSSRMTKSNPYHYMSKADAERLVKHLYTSSKDTTINILKIKRPNVVIVIIESFTANLTQTLGAEKDITPNFDSLMHQGVLFSRIYSTGDRTDKGLVGTLAGFPTLASGSIVKWPEKMERIPMIAQPLAHAGYSTSFYYGGESEFDNYKAFILSHKVARLVDRNDIKTGKETSWGHFDEDVFAKQNHDLTREKQPFFSALLTLTNHEPYGLPGGYYFGKSDNVAKFKSTAHYTDSCINVYLNNAKKQSWYKNTLFVFIADHGHKMPKNIHEIYVPERYHIPLLLYGDVIKKEFRGRRFNNVGSQVDVVATILGQLNIDAKAFRWSKNLFNPSLPSFAFFSWDNGMGFIDNQQCVTFDNVGKTNLYNSDEKNQQGTQTRLANAKAYLQTIYQQFIEL